MYKSNEKNVFEFVNPVHYNKISCGMIKVKCNGDGDIFTLNQYLFRHYLE